MMGSGLAARVGVSVMDALLFAGLAAHAQEHVQLVPQLGVDSFTSVAFSPDGRFVLTGGEEPRARLWDAATGMQIRLFEGHTGPVNSVAFSPDGHTVLTGSRDKTARLWDVATGQQIRSFEGNRDAILSVAFSPDGRFVVTGSWDET